MPDLKSQITEVEQAIGAALDAYSQRIEKALKAAAATAPAPTAAQPNQAAAPQRQDDSRRAAQRGRELRPDRDGGRAQPDPLLLAVMNDAELTRRAHSPRRSGLVTIWIARRPPRRGAGRGRTRSSGAPIGSYRCASTARSGRRRPSVSAPRLSSSGKRQRIAEIEQIGATLGQQNAVTRFQMLRDAHLLRATKLICARTAGARASWR